LANKFPQNNKTSKEKWHIVVKFAEGRTILDRYYIDSITARKKVNKKVQDLSEYST
jgi:hypothetical protein